jgi:HSP20 family protein
MTPAKASIPGKGVPAMSDTANKRYVIFLTALSLVLAIAVCAQATHILRLKGAARPADEPASVPVVAQAPSSGSGPAQPPWLGPPLGLRLPLDTDPWEPFGEMQRMREEIDRMFGSAFSRFGGRDGLMPRAAGFSPRLDLSEEGDAFVVRVDIPGAEKSDIELKVEERTLTISGKREEAVEEEDRDKGFLRRERRSGEFRRTLALPEDVDPSSVTAKFRNGVLEVTVPKTHGEKPESRIIRIE